MTTMEDVPSIREYFGFKLASAVAKRKKVKQSTVPALYESIVRLMLHLAGFGCLTYAGFQWTIMAGFIVAGISCFLLSTLTTRKSQDDNDSNQPQQPQFRR